MTWGAARRRHWPLPVAVVLFLLGTAVTVATLTVTEYGGPLVPTWLGLLGLLPCAVGIVAVAQLWRSARR